MDIHPRPRDRCVDLLAQGCLEEGAESWAKPMLLQQETDAMCLEEWCNTNLQHRQTASKRERADDAKKSMTNRTTRYEERSAAHCTPMQCITSGACDGQDACHSRPQRSGSFKHDVQLAHNAGRDCDATCFGVYPICYHQGPSICIIYLTESHSYASCMSPAVL